MKKYLFEVIVCIAMFFGVSTNFVILSAGDSRTLADIFPKSQSMILVPTELKNSLELHKKRFGTYPASFDQIKDYFETSPKDRWGKPLRLLLESSDSYIISSDGEDNFTDTADDIKYFSKSDTVVYPKENMFFPYIGTLFFAISAIAFVFCLFVLNPYIFFKQYSDLAASHRISILLCVLMGTSFFTWPNLIPMAFRFSKSAKKFRFTPLLAILFALTNISVGLLFFYSKRIRLS
ncbi:MAG: hypothetical protein EOO46_23615 [Flavobacterium sp.]|nr:MAG: hypothetical protein EOO46_23615 [Flavobacterium sp.]